MTQTLRTSSRGEAITRIMATALDAVDPATAVSAALKRQGNALWVGEKQVDLEKIRHIYLIAIGKAGSPMALAAAQVLGNALTQGIVVTKDGHTVSGSQMTPQISVFETGHPVPDQRGVRAARRVKELLATTRRDDLVLCLISGGGSALFTSPAAGITLEDLQALTQALLASGATIQEINTLRKHLDEVKGGRLARLAMPAETLALILSDVIGDPLDVIASGLTVPDPSTFANALQIIKRYHLENDLPPAIIQTLIKGKDGLIAETSKPEDPIFQRVENLVIGNNLLAAQAAVKQAQREGLHSLLLTTSVQGEARQVGTRMAATLRQAAESGEPLRRPLCIIAGGETTVTLQGDGTGGRNQELALASVPVLAGLQDVVLAALATDGGDGPTDAAGAVVSGETYSRARAHGLDPADFLKRNDAYHFFSPLGDLLKPGPTLTNVNDLVLLFAF